MVRFVDQPDAGATFSEKETVVTLESVKAVGEVSRLSSQLSFSPRSSHGSSASVSLSAKRVWGHSGWTGLDLFPSTRPSDPLGLVFMVAVLKSWWRFPHVGDFWNLQHPSPTLM